MSPLTCQADTASSSQQENITSNNQSKERNSSASNSAFAGFEIPQISVPKPLAPLPSQHPLPGAYR